MPLYLMPMAANARGFIAPKYQSTFTAAGFPLSTIRFGSHPHALVFSPCDAATDAAVAVNADVHRLPANLDSAPSAAQITAVQTFLEAHNIPAHWLISGMTWRTIVRDVVSVFLFMQRYHGLGGSPVFSAGTTLDSTFGSLPAGVRQGLQQAAADQSFDTSGLTAASTLREILRAMGQQWGARPIVIHGVSI
jgi:hypothetical protein